MNRYLVLFAREPRREAREKGFGAQGADLFATFAAGWLEAAQGCGARLILATPVEDRAAWEGLLPDNVNAIWIPQRGASFGQRLAGVARRACALPGHVVLVGGDVAPSGGALADAFAALESGADAVLAPATDGGVSLVAVSAADADLLAALAPRQRGVLASLARGLKARSRRVVFVDPVADVDGRRSLGSLLRFLTPEFRALARRALEATVSFVSDEFVSLRTRLLPPSGLRAPPLPA